MIKYLQSLAVFAAVVETGAFNKAARKLDLTASVVSHHVSKLENHLGVTLLYRSTRTLSLTDDGRKVYDAARRIVSAADEALDLIADASDEPVGALRVSMPAFVPIGGLEPAIWAFVARHSGVALSIHYSDHPVDLIAEGYDLAFRVGHPRDSSLQMKRIAETALRLVAAPALLARQGTPKVPEDLAELDFIALDGLPETLSLVRGKETVKVRPLSYRIMVDSIHAAHSAAKAGIGAMPLPPALLAGARETGELVDVLPQWKLPALPIYALWPAKARRNSLMRRLLDSLKPL